MTCWICIDVQAHGPLTRSAAATRLDAATTCDGWNVATLVSHMLETQRYFAGVAHGEDVSPPSPIPAELATDDPIEAFRGRAEIIRTFAAPGVIEKTGPSLGIAFADQLIHGWDLAKSTDQDATMPEGLPDAAYEMIYGRFTEEQRKGVFKPTVAVASTASAQDRLLSYTGRDPATVVAPKR